MLTSLSTDAPMDYTGGKSQRWARPTLSCVIFPLQVLNQAAPWPFQRYVALTRILTLASSVRPMRESRCTSDSIWAAPSSA
eukprot:4730675-Prymnesium_polylepis.1